MSGAARRDDRSGRERALVLGGGGVLGIAWETGLLAGLASAGVDVVADADLVVGTSAGATVAVQASTAPIADLYAAQVEGTSAPEPAVDVDMPALLERISEVLSTVTDPIAARRRVGEMALAHDRVPETERRAIIAARLPVHEWPDRRVVVTTIRADTGEFRTLDRDSGVDVVDAVAASCAIPEVWPAVTIDGARHYDGGLRSGTNADVAKGYAKVLVVRVLDLPETSDVEDLSSTSAVHVVAPDEASEVAIGEHLLDPAGIPKAAKAGHDQGVRIADEVREFLR